MDGRESGRALSARRRAIGGAARRSTLFPTKSKDAAAFAMGPRAQRGREQRGEVIPGRVPENGSVRLGSMYLYIGGGVVW